MTTVQKIYIAFVFILWSATVAAFDVEGISYDVLSESARTACVARQMVPGQLVGDIKILSKVSYGGKEYTVTEINGWAFGACSKMTSIAIPATMQKIGYSAFSGCYGLKAVHIEDLTAWCNMSYVGGSECNPLSLAHRLFLNGEEVKELVIPDDVTVIANEAFHNATAISSLVIPSSVTQIGSNAFAGCS